ncbi:MAG: PKD domain-containing protein [Candidatus Omnitrophica bacterium]|jgi:PKD repeat protein|nr:PKD domain-containing protein [Candidatus Omnitrophota bacterium]
MSIYSGILASGNIVFGDSYTVVNLNIPKSFIESQIVSGSICTGESYTVINLNIPKSFVDAQVINRHIYSGEFYTKVNNNRVYNNGSLIVTVPRSGLANDTGMLLILGYYTDFYANPRLSYPYNNIYFYDNTYGPDISSYYWNFGDGNYSTERDPIHFYTHTGLYDVSLETTSINGETAYLNKTNYINIQSNNVSVNHSDYKIVILNKRISPYKSNDLLQISVQLYENNKKKLFYIKDVVLTLNLNYPNGWQAYSSGITNKTGSCVLYQSSSGILSSNCLGYVSATINNQSYISNIIRFNFIN